MGVILFQHLTLKSSLGSTFPSLLKVSGLSSSYLTPFFSCVVCPFFIICCLLCTATTNVRRGFNCTLRLAALFHHYVSTMHVSTATHWTIINCSAAITPHTSLLHYCHVSIPSICTPEWILADGKIPCRIHFNE